MAIHVGSWITSWHTRTLLVLRLVPASVRVIRLRAGFLPRGVTEYAGLAFHQTTIRGSHARLSSGTSRALFASTSTRLRPTATTTGSPDRKDAARLAVMIKINN
ncbi:hypothetical protein PF011_g32967 [Phytophthora fragariae]|uniref:Secreted protein n=1 Tax=Phytophthora fragariae TaxID=53985 RepID=A0A6A3GBW6_9STRA|nr:hypothetical protein PF011_g32967 [Phytophthora fragariae]